MRQLSFAALTALTLTLGLPAPGLVAPASAQSANGVSAAAIRKLEDRVVEIRHDIVKLRATDAVEADQLMSTLGDLHDDVIYLKVKLRKGQRVSFQEYGDLNGRLEDFAARVQVALAPPPPPPPPAPVSPAPPAESSDAGTPRVMRELPVGTLLDARLQETLSSATAAVEDHVQATTAVDLIRGDRVLVPAGSLMRGVVTSVTKATRLDRKGQLTMSFDRITINGTTYQMRGTVTEASEGIAGEKAKIGTGAGIGAIIGGLLGGFKGVLAGVLIGGGGMVAATPGKDVELPAGTVLRVRIDSPLTVVEGGGNRR
ncbi:MAG: hypothetical protein KGN76_03555 [Acidobacteriota bacterium]|nr:hypothetical protein [Acidobacteriota bacterium]